MKNKRCPRCKKFIIGRPAHSRLNYKIEICSECGLMEALEAYYKAKRERGNYNAKYNQRKDTKHKQ